MSHIFRGSFRINDNELLAPALDEQFKYVDHWTEQLPDTNGNLREGIRFELAPVGTVAAESE